MAAKKKSKKTGADKKKLNKKATEPVKAQKPKAIPVKELPLVSAPKWLPLLFIGLSFILYFQCIPYGFVLDDKIVYSENTFTKSGFAGIGDILGNDTFLGYFGEKKDLLEGGRYRPLSLVSFAIEHQIFGLNPKVAHIINILLYGLCAWLVFLVLRHLTRSFESKNWWWSIAFIGTMIYLVHPVHTEAVANIKGRDEIMVMIFSLLTMLFSFKYAADRKLWQLILLAAFFYLGLLSKENAITFLAVIPVALLLFKNNGKVPAMVIFGTLFTITLSYLFTRYRIIGYLLDGKEVTDVMNNPFAGMSSSERSGSILYTLYEYLRLSIFPHPLTHDYYPYHIPKTGFGHWKVILSIVLHAGLVIYSLLNFKKHKLISFGIWFYIFTISIVSNIVVGVGTFMNERFIFISSLGVCLIIAYLLFKGSKKWDPKIFYGILAVILISFSAKTFLRIPVWQDAFTLNSAAVKVSKNSARANSFMATAYFNNFQATQDRATKIQYLNEGSVYADQALRIIPGYSNANLMKVGFAAEKYKMGENNLDQLLATFKEVIAVAPQIGYITEYCKYLNGGRADSQKLVDFYYDVGYNVLFKQKRINDWAVHYLTMGNELDPNNANIRSAIYQGYMALGNPTAAEKYK